MKKLLTTIVEIISILFIILWVYAAASKLIDHEKFRIQLSQSPMLTGAAAAIAWAVPVVEIVIAIALAWPRFRPAGLYASFSLMTIFTAYIVTITNFSEYVPCSCGGVLEKMSWNEHLVFNVCFVVIAACGILLQSMPAPIRWHSSSQNTT